jgi:hypothetical protein
VRSSARLAVRMTFAPSARARLAVSSPMPALPPIRTTVCPSSSASRRIADDVVDVLMTSARVTGEDEVTILGRRVTPEAGLVHPLVGGLAVIELRKPPTAS